MKVYCGVKSVYLRCLESTTAPATSLASAVVASIATSVAATTTIAPLVHVVRSCPVITVLLVPLWSPTVALVSIVTKVLLVTPTTTAASPLVTTPVTAPLVASPSTTTSSLVVIPGVGIVPATALVVSITT